MWVKRVRKYLSNVFYAWASISSRRVQALDKRLLQYSMTKYIHLWRMEIQLQWKKEKVSYNKIWSHYRRASSKYGNVQFFFLLIQNNSSSDCYEDCILGKIQTIIPKKWYKIWTHRKIHPYRSLTSPMQENSFGDDWYFLMTKDDNSYWRSLYFIKNKSEIPRYLESFFKKTNKAFRKRNQDFQIK